MRPHTYMIQPGFFLLLISYVNLIIRPTEEPRRVEEKIFLPNSSLCLSFLIHTIGIIVMPTHGVVGGRQEIIQAGSSHSAWLCVRNLLASL